MLGRRGRGSSVSMGTELPSESSPYSAGVSRRIVAILDPIKKAWGMTVAPTMLMG